MSEKESLRESFEENLDDVDFPVSSPMDLAPYLPNGPATTFEGEDVEFTAMELMTNTQNHIDDGPNDGFPYDDGDEMIEDALYALEEAGVLPEEDE